MLFSFLKLSAVSLANPPPIVGGTTDNNHPEVVLLNQGGVCSGTIIDPKWILTAAHCVDFLTSTDALIVYAGVQPSDGDNDFKSLSAAIHVHPNYGSGLEVGFDIALVELVQPVSTIVPAVLNDTPPQDWTWPVDLRLVGYGITTPGGNDAGTRRYVDSAFYGFDELWIAVSEPGYNFCTGDSGGATFLPTEIGFVLSGVNAWVGSDEGQDPCLEGMGGATRVDIALEWILTHVPDVAVYSDLVDEPEPEPEPEPASEPGHEVDSDTGEKARYSQKREPESKAGCQMTMMSPIIMAISIPFILSRQRL